MTSPTLEATRPLRNWVLCRPLSPARERGGILLPTNLEDRTVSEGVAEVVAVGPGLPTDDGGSLDHGLRPGDRVLYRGFLRFAHQVGETFGLDRRQAFLMDARDALAVVEGGGGALGLYGEYVL